MSYLARAEGLVNRIGRSGERWSGISALVARHDDDDDDDDDDDLFTSPSARAGYDTRSILSGV